MLITLILNVIKSTQLYTIFSTKLFLKMKLFRRHSPRFSNVINEYIKKENRGTIMKYCKLHISLSYEVCKHVELLMDFEFINNQFMLLSLFIIRCWIIFFQMIWNLSWPALNNNTFFSTFFLINKLILSVPNINVRRKMFF